MLPNLPGKAMREPQNVGWAASSDLTLFLCPYINEALIIMHLFCICPACKIVNMSDNHRDLNLQLKNFLLIENFMLLLQVMTSNRLLTAGSMH